jgi:tetratricopeptide (TPR) repeat protein
LGAAVRRALDREVVVILSALGSVAFYVGNPGRCRRLSVAALARGALIGERAEEVPALLNLAFCDKEEAKYGEARDLYLLALATSQNLGDLNRVGVILNNIGNVERALGNYRLAREHLEAALEVGRDVGNNRLVSFALNNLGNVAEVEGDLDAARRYFEESVKIKKELNDRRQLPESLSNLAGVLAKLGLTAEAAAAARDGLAAAERMGHARKAALCWERLGQVLMRDGDVGGARNALVAAWAIWGAEKDPNLAPATLGAKIAALLSLEGRRNEAARVAAALPPEETDVSVNREIHAHLAAVSLAPGGATTADDWRALVAAYLGETGEPAGS